MKTRLRKEGRAAAKKSMLENLQHAEDTIVVTRQEVETLDRYASALLALRILLEKALSEVEPAEIADLLGPISDPLYDLWESLDRRLPQRKD